jgi:hypothetical protein
MITIRNYYITEERKVRAGKTGPIFSDIISLSYAMTGQEVKEKYQQDLRDSAIVYAMVTKVTDRGTFCVAGFGR